MSAPAAAAKPKLTNSLPSRARGASPVRVPARQALDSRGADPRLARKVEESSLLRPVRFFFARLMGPPGLGSQASALRPQPEPRLRARGGRNLRPRRAARHFHVPLLVARQSAIFGGASLWGAERWRRRQTISRALICMASRAPSGAGGESVRKVCGARNKAARRQLCLLGARDFSIYSSASCFIFLPAPAPAPAAETALNLCARFAPLIWRALACQPPPRCRGASAGEIGGAR